MASGRLVDYLGCGIIADRPATPDLAPDALGLWYATDTDTLSAWDGSTWEDVSAGGGSVSWGGITGTLADQTDLQSALDGKLGDAPSDGSIYGRKDGAWEVVAGSGDVTGPASSVADRIATYSDTTGKLIKDGGKTIAEVRLIEQNSQSTAYTAVLSDAGKHLLHPSADTTARTFTIPANSSVAYPIGTAITFVNQNGAGTLTIAITTDTMRLAGAGTTGSRTLAANGMATALKITSTEWIISGTGLT